MTDHTAPPDRPASAADRPGGTAGSTADRPGGAALPSRFGIDRTVVGIGPGPAFTPSG